MKIRPMRCSMRTEGWTDGRTHVMKLIVSSYNFANTPKEVQNPRFLPSNLTENSRR
jgi:hypothetical protein